jgi:hypothetical protein
MGWECLASERRTMTISVSILGMALLVVMLAYLGKPFVFFFANYYFISFYLFSKLAFGDSNDEEALRTVRMISIISRHGDRSPTKLFKLDPNIKHKWHGGVGALSEVRYINIVWFSSLPYLFTIVCCTSLSFISKWNILYNLHVITLFNTFYRKDLCKCTIWGKI